jgi:hypothetical protein
MKELSSLFDAHDDWPGDSPVSVLWIARDRRIDRIVGQLSNGTLREPQRSTQTLESGPFDDRDDLLYTLLQGIVRQLR